MKMMIGVGLLLEGEAFNLLREAEITAARKTGNFDGLRQPPHVTIKRPFEVNSAKDFTQAVSVIEKTISLFHRLSVRLSELSSFGDQTLYAAVQDSTEIMAMHTALVESLKQIGIEHDEFELENVVFHTSVAMNLQPGQLQVAEQTCKKMFFEETVTEIKKVGLFLGLDDDKSWIVIKEWELNQDL